MSDARPKSLAARRAAGFAALAAALGALVVPIACKGAPMNQKPKGFLLSASGDMSSVLDARPGKAFLMPGVPLDPAAPGPDAMRIGIIDSGVFSNHPQLRGLVVAQRDFAGADPADRIGHGTVVALQFLKGTGGKLASPAIVSAKVTDSAGVPSVEAVVAALRWMVKQRVRIVNVSLGFVGQANEYSRLCKAIEAAHEVMFVVASGNFGPDVAVFPAACGDCPNLIAVGAVGDGGAVDPTSGSGDIYAPSTAVVAAPWTYFLDEGMAAARRGEYVAARALYDRSLSLEDNPEAHFQIGLLDYRDGKLEAAHDQFLRAVKLAPDVSILHTHLGAVLFEQDRYAEAERELREAIRLDPKEPIAHFNLGQTLLEVGRRKEALEEFTTVQKLKPDYPRISEAIERAQHER